jgi:hypothetical protein
LKMLAGRQLSQVPIPHLCRNQANTSNKDRRQDSEC